MAEAGAAGVRFRFEAVASGENPVAYGGSGLIDADRSRLDFDSGSHPSFNDSMTIFTRRGGRETIIMDRADRTWFERAVTEETRGVLSAFNAPWQTGADQVEVRLESLGREEIAGHPARRYRLSIAYRIEMNVGGEVVNARVESESELWLSRRIRNRALPWGIQFALKTGFREVDARVARLLASRGLPLRQVVTVRRTLEGGEAYVEKLTIELSDLQAIELTPVDFAPPAGFAYREPTLRAPERDSEPR